MKRHKKLLCLILTLVLTLSLTAGCTKGESTAGTESGTDAAETSETGVPVDYAAFSYSDGIDENGFFESVKALDYVKDFNYRGLSIPGDVHQIPQDSVQAEIDNIQDRYATDEHVTDRAVIDGDTVNIDYVGSVDSVPFDGGSTGGSGTDVTIGVTSYIDDFLEQLIGHTPGETINVEVTFPDDYHEASLQGKDAVFVTTVNYIVEAKPVELTDEFVKTNFFDLYGWETADAMREGMAKVLQDTAIENYIYEYLISDVDVSSIPDKITSYQEKVMLRYYAGAAESYGMELEPFLNTYVGVTGVDELIDSNREGNLESAKYSLISQAVAESANISVSEDDMKEHLDDYSEYVEEYGLPYLKQIVLFEKVIEYIADNSVLE